MFGYAPVEGGDEAQVSLNYVKQLTSQSIRLEKKWRYKMEKTKMIERRFEFQARAIGEEGKQELWVEGYAARFNSPTVLFEYDGVEYKEQIASDAFTDCKMDDVIFNYNHTGRVMARTRNKTLQLAVDDNGLFIRARLDGTEEGRSLYNDIQNGYIDRMSFRFPDSTGGIRLPEPSMDGSESQAFIRCQRRGHTGV